MLHSAYCKGFVAIIVYMIEQIMETDIYGKVLAAVYL